MAASFNSLPVEIVKKIVETVHEQDAATRELDLEQGRLFEPEGSDDEEEDRETNVPQGRWTGWHGKGVRALVQVDRRTRQLALPHLYERITKKQIDSDIFQLEVIDEPLAQHIRHLDLHYLKGTAPISLTRALRMLTGTSSVTIGVDVARLAYDASDDYGVAMFARNFKETLQRVTSLETRSTGRSDLVNVLNDVDTNRLRKLALPASLLRNGDNRVFQVLNELVALDELQLDNLYNSSMTQLEAHVRLPSLRTVVLGARVAYERCLRLAHFLAPCLSTLIIHPPYGNVMSDPLQPLPNPVLPTLRTLVIRRTAVYLPAFHEARPPALEHFSIDFADDVEAFPLAEEYLSSSDTPTSLRAITISISSRQNRRPSAAFRSACAVRGIQLRLIRRPVSAETLAHPTAQPVASKTTAHDLEETLEWAKRRARALVEVGDGVGLHELAQATVRLRERHLIDLA